MTAKIQCIKLALDIIIKQNNNNNNRTINKVSRYVYGLRLPVNYMIYFGMAIKEPEHGAPVGLGVVHICAFDHLNFNHRIQSKS